MQERIETTVGAFKVTVLKRTWASKPRPAEYHAATRVYVDANCLPVVSEKYSDLAFQEENLGDRRWSEIGLFPEVDALYKRLNREHARAANQVAQVVLALDIEGLSVPAAMKTRFSRRAGCSCPCSPGVILPNALRLGGAPVDIWVSLK